MVIKESSDKYSKTRWIYSEDGNFQKLLQTLAPYSREKILNFENRKSYEKSPIFGHSPIYRQKIDGRFDDEIDVTIIDDRDLVSQPILMACWRF
jgi:hypothetical protein